jgi:hypothetical protein
MKKPLRIFQSKARILNTVLFGWNIPGKFKKEFRSSAFGLPIFKILRDN